MRRVLFIAVPALVVLVILVGVSAIATLRGYEVALPGRVLGFPRDHAAHPAFQSEWWYYTAHLRTADSEEYGYQLSFFQRRIDEGTWLSAPSQWSPQHLYMAHYAISDKQRKRLIFADHELDTKNSTRVVYWEGRVLVEGAHNRQAISGTGYVELVGYKMKIDL